MVASLFLPARQPWYESSCLHRWKATACDIALILNPGPITSRLNRGIAKIGKKQAGAALSDGVACSHHQWTQPRLVHQGTSVRKEVM